MLMGGGGRGVLSFVCDCVGGLCGMCVDLRACLRVLQEECNSCWGGGRDSYWRGGGVCRESGREEMLAMILC